MPTIKHSDAAPNEAVGYALANVNFSLGDGEAGYETDDRSVISAAEAHPWLTVEYPEADEAADYGRYGPSVDPDEDVLGAARSVAFDLDEVREVEEAKRIVATSHTAIEAGLDQGEPAEVGGVAVTLAADEAQPDEPVLEPVNDPDDEPDFTRGNI